MVVTSRSNSPILELPVGGGYGYPIFGMGEKSADHGLGTRDAEFDPYDGIEDVESRVHRDLSKTIT